MRHNSLFATAGILLHLFACADCFAVSK